MMQAVDLAPSRYRLEVSELSHRFGSRSVLEGLAFAVRPGEIFGLLGPNGSGKSTALRALTGMLVPDAGRFVFEGQPVAAGGRALRRRMGVVFQASSVDARLSARENLDLVAGLYGLGPAVARARRDELLEFAGLSDRRDEAVSTFSGGMRRRLELARALLADPSLLVMDEPTTGLDERFFREAWERIEALRSRRGLSVVLTTHRAEEAQRCDRVAVIDGGRVIAEDHPETLRQRVSGDILTLETEQPDRLCTEIARRFQLEARLVDGRVVIERERGHELIPRLVEALPVGSIRSLSMHRPTLADVFVKLTGRSLREESTTPEAPAGPERVRGKA